VTPRPAPRRPATALGPPPGSKRGPSPATANPPTWPPRYQNTSSAAPSDKHVKALGHADNGGSVRALRGSGGQLSVLSTVGLNACRSGLDLTALWPQDRSSGLHGPALPDMDFRNRASSNFWSNFVSESESTGFVEDLVRLQAEAAGDDFFLDLGGAAEDRLDAAEPPELTIVAESSGLMRAPFKAGSIWSARAVALGRCDLGGDHPPWDRLAASQLPGPWRGLDDDAEPAAADVPAAGADVDSGAHRGTAATGPRDARCQRRRPGGVALRRAVARQSGSRPGSGRSPRQHGHVRRSVTTATADRRPHGGVALEPATLPRALRTPPRGGAEGKRRCGGAAAQPPRTGDAARRTSLAAATTKEGTRNRKNRHSVPFSSARPA
jgi:hypothetical protein